MSELWEKDYVANLMQAYKDEPSQTTKSATLRPIRANHVSGLNLAILRRQNNIPLNPELAALLAEHEASERRAKAEAP